jgi:hypothetical protein
MPLLRQLIVNGSPDEYSLSQLADARPLFLELDPAWDRRLLDHVRPSGLWFAFAPHGLSASDRQNGSSESLAVLSGLLGEPELEGALDPITAEVIARGTGARALALTALGDNVAAGQLLAGLRRVRPDDPLALELAARLERPERGHVAANELFE